MTKVSIITPVHCDNSDKVDWLLETMQSVQNQTLADWEMILINDKSPSNLGEARVKWTDDKRVRWFDLAKQSGPALARNMAVRLAQSDCILPLDADDLLPDMDTLEVMYDAWLLDKTKIIYGNLRQLIPAADFTFQPATKIFNLPEYNFHDDKLMLNGAMTVSSMHHINCHYAAGGWKPIFEYGLEDVEYWYAAGLAGYCGQKINSVTLLYRKHGNSRTEKMKQAMQFQVTQRKIIELHNDPIRKGIYPMSCCGGNKKTSQAAVVSNDPLVMSSQGKAAKGMIVPLEGFPDEELEWVLYGGPKKGRFDVAFGPSKYTIFGTGQIFQIHKSHRSFFEARQRQGFVMNQLDPRAQQEPELEIAVTKAPRPETFIAPEPELPVVERVDQIVMDTEPEIVIAPSPETILTVDNLDTSDGIKAILRRASIVNLETLATSSVEKLTLLPGIGEKRARGLISKAKELL